jgi:hypothetical protein
MEKYGNIITLLTNYPNKMWNWTNLSSHPDITLEFIQNNLDKPWDWKKLSSNPALNLEKIEKINPEV